MFDCHKMETIVFLQLNDFSDLLHIMSAYFVLQSVISNSIEVNNYFKIFKFLDVVIL